MNGLPVNAKRGGYDDDQRSDDRASGVRPNYPRPSTSQAAEPVEAIVKRFNAEKGFGFVTVVGGCDAFIHIRQLEAAGHSSAFKTNVLNSRAFECMKRSSTQTRPI
jgi:hypothetical protein